MESKSALRTWETTEGDSQYPWDMEVHIKYLPLKINAKSNCESGCNAIGKPRRRQLLLTRLHQQDLRIVAGLGTIGLWRIMEDFMALEFLPESNLPSFFTGKIGVLQDKEVKTSIPYCKSLFWVQFLTLHLWEEDIGLVLMEAVYSFSK